MEPHSETLGEIRIEPGSMIAIFQPMDLWWIVMAYALHNFILLGLWEWIGRGLL